MVVIWVVAFRSLPALLAGHSIAQNTSVIAADRNASASARVQGRQAGNICRDASQTTER